MLCNVQWDVTTTERGNRRVTELPFHFKRKHDESPNARFGKHAMNRHREKGNFNRICTITPCINHRSKECMYTGSITWNDEKKQHILTRFPPADIRRRPTGTWRCTGICWPSCPLSWSYGGQTCPPLTPCLYNNCRWDSETRVSVFSRA